MPFDNIYWNGGISFKEPGEVEDSGAKECRVGKTANGNPHSTFSFVGNRRTQILNRNTRLGFVNLNPINKDPHEYLLGTTAGTAQAYAGGLVNSMVSSDIPASAPGGTTLFDCQNRESAHHMGQSLHMADNANYFNGIHHSDMLSITTTGKPYKGCYLVLKRKRFFYTEYNITTSLGTMQSNVTVGGVSVPVTEAVINPAITPKEQDFTGEVAIKTISIFKNGTILKPSSFLEVPSTSILDFSTTGNPAITCNVSGSTVSFNNMFQGNNEARRYFKDDFKIKIGGTDFDISSVNTGGTITISGSPGTLNNVAFSIMIPMGSPDMSTAGHVSDSGKVTSTTSTTGWEGFTWGGLPSKFLGSSTLFENQDNYGGNPTSVEGPSTRSPYFSNVDAEEVIIESIKNGGADLFWTLVNYSWLKKGSFTHNDPLLPNQSPTVNHFTKPSLVSSATFPDFGINLNGTVPGSSNAFPTDIKNTRDAAIQSWESAAGIDVTHWDGPNRAYRSHAGANSAPHLVAGKDPLNNAASVQKASRNSHKYPYVLNTFGWGSTEPNATAGASSPLAQQNVDHPHCFVILDTDQVIPPGTTFEVAIDTGDFGESLNFRNSPSEVGKRLTGGVLSEDLFNYTRTQKPINEFELFIVAK